MKNIYNLLIAFIFSVGFVSCENEDNFMLLTQPAEFQITSPTTGSSVVLDPAFGSNPGITLTWEAANYSSPTAVTYTIEVAKSGTNFADPIAATSTNNRFATLTIDELNGAAAGAGLTPFVEEGLDIRIKSTVGTRASMTKYSNVITYLVTTYTTDLPKIAVPGNHQAWNPPTAPRLAASAFGETDYEGFLWLDGEYKFLDPNSTGDFQWGNTDYGDDGSFSGVLVATNEVNCTAPAGYYRLKANTETGTYIADPTNWGIVGAATPGGWDNSTPLTYNPVTKRLEAVMTLTAGEFKFRANNTWTINIGGDNDGDGSMNFDGPNLSIATGGTYTVILDLSNPRAYTYSIQ